MVVCIDVGLKRIGVAFAFNNLVLPSEPILRKNRNQAARDVSQMLKEKSAKTLIVGLPLGGSAEDEMKRRIYHFVSLLDFKGEIIYQDESLSSIEASEFGRDKRDGKFDSLAAMVILKRFLNV